MADADDQKMSFMEHLGELRVRIVRALYALLAGAAIALPFSQWVVDWLARPLTSPPGEVMRYSTGNTHLLSAILTRATGKSTWQFANEALARPLGFTFAQWPRDPQGIYFGGNDMLMTPRQMVRLGELYLNRGRATGDSSAPQIVSPEWVDTSCIGRARSQFSGQLYGYSWWTREIGGQETCFAWGYGGQYVFVVPALSLVIVTTSSTDVSDERRGHRRTVFDMVERLVVDSMAETQASGPHGLPAAFRNIRLMPSR